jgi:dihydroorotase
MAVRAVSHPVSGINDSHLHVRQEGSGIFDIATRISASYCSAMLVMPNTEPAILTRESAFEYRETILSSAAAACRDRSLPEVVMTIKMTQDMDPATIEAIPRNSDVQGIKVYTTFPPEYTHGGPTPLHNEIRKGRGSVTTNSHGGVHNMFAPNILACLEVLQDRGDIVVEYHAAKAGVPPQTAEETWLREHFPKQGLNLRKLFPRLRMMIEHLSTKVGLEILHDCGPNTWGGVTGHHLYTTNEDVLSGFVQAHHHCMPTPNSEEDMRALIAAVLGNDPQLIFGSDSAPHDVTKKLHHGGCAGVFTAPVIPSIMTYLFHTFGQMKHFDDFMSKRMGDVYRLNPPSHDFELEMVQERWTVPEVYTRGTAKVVPFLKGKTLDFRPYVNGRPLDFEELIAA